MGANSRLRIVVLGYVVRGPLGGLAWHHLQYVLGLARLGHDVAFLEDSGDYPACYDPIRGVKDADPTFGLDFAGAAFRWLGLDKRWAYFDAHTGAWHGPLAERMVGLCASADLLLNVSGVNPLRSWTGAIPTRALIDTDPAFTQIRHLTDPDARRLAADHTRFFSFGENIGVDARVPDDGFPWQPTRQPVVLDAWPVTAPPEGARFTSVMQWESYPARDYGGVRFGMKADSFLPYLDLPRRVGASFELLLGSPSAPRDLLRQRGWRLDDPIAIARDPQSYRRYIQASRAEFAVAKHGYVVSNSGWFSERSANYLASGRPVVAQETGFSRWLRADGGVLTFADPEEAVAAMTEVDARYDHHRRAAREVAEAYFASDTVLGDLLRRATTTPGPSRRESTDTASGPR